MILMGKTRTKKIDFSNFGFFLTFSSVFGKSVGQKCSKFGFCSKNARKMMDFWLVKFPNTDEKVRKKTKFEKIIFLVLVLLIKIIKNQTECPRDPWTSISRVTKKSFTFKIDQIHENCEIHTKPMEMNTFWWFFL